MGTKPHVTPISDNAAIIGVVLSKPRISIFLLLRKTKKKTVLKILFSK
jgi:hypothetical protein